MKSTVDGEKGQSIPHGLIVDVKKIIEQARAQAYSAINSAMVQAFWLLGRRIVKEEQGGEKRAEYGQQLIATLARELTDEFGKGFLERNVWEFRKFYLTFPLDHILHSVSAEFIENAAAPILHALNAELQKDKNMEPKRDAASPESEREILRVLFTRLSWTHIRHLLRVSDPSAREYYIRETAANAWSTRTLDRNISTQYYQRLLASQVKEPVVREMEEKTATFQNEKLEFIKNPSVLEFLNLPTQIGLTESKIETAIINNLHHFLLELGKGFAFVERQKLIRTEVRDYFIDLVFYNYILKCFVLIDLKTERITHQDVGQMDMYVRMYDETIRCEDDNPTVGIVLCSETDRDIARYSILKGNEQIFATKYKLYLPTAEELAAEIAREKELIRLQLEQGE